MSSDKSDICKKKITYHYAKFLLTNRLYEIGFQNKIKKTISFIDKVGRGKGRHI